MNKILSLLIFITSFLSAQKINFEKGSFNSLLEKAAKQDKLIFVDAYAEWCGPCKLMERNVFTNAEVGAYFNENFINAQIDMEKGEGVELAMRYGVSAYPSLLFLNSKGEVVQKFIGYYDAKNFLKIGKEVADPANAMDNLVKRFDAGETDAQFLLDLIRKTVYQDYDLAKKVSERYFALKKDNSFTEEEASMLMYFIKSTSDPNYKIFIAHKDNLIKRIPANKYNEFDVNLKLMGITEKSIDPATLAINDAYFLAEAEKSVGKENAENALKRLKINFYLHLRKNVEYQKVALDYYKDAERFEADELSSAAWNFYNIATDDAALKTALSWAILGVAKKQTAKTTLVLAYLYKKTGDKKNALSWALKSQDLHRKEKVDLQAVAQLIKELKTK